MNQKFIDRLLKLPPAGTETFLLFGPRQTGKTSLLRHTYKRDIANPLIWIDLLKAEEFRRYSERPWLLREEVEAYKTSPFVVIDEIQKVPQLLDEAHYLHEAKGIRLALCGSSARKIKRGKGNLLGGRAIVYNLFGFTANELGKLWEIDKMLSQGYLPKIYLSKRHVRLLDAYVSTYLKEEIMSEGLVRRLPPFSNFLTAASFSDGEPVNYSTIARDCGVSSQTIRGYFDILVDTHLGSWLPAWRKRAKRRVSVSPKFYFSDIGVVNYLTRRFSLPRGTPEYGKAFENWCFHELTAYNSYKECYFRLSYWRLPSGIEVDFIVNDMEVAIEAKAVELVQPRHLKGLRTLKEEFPSVKKRVVVSLEPKRRLTEDKILILPPSDFVKILWSGELFYTNVV